MDTLLLINIGLLLVLVAAVGYLLLKTRRGDESGAAARLQQTVDNLKLEILSKQMEGLVSLRESLDSAGRSMNERLAEGTSTMDRRLSVVAEIENKLGQFQQQAVQLEELGHNIEALSDLLRPPKLRGGLGELLLENLLSQILPPSLYETQYRFADGSRVDAVIRVGERILPVDSKFPLDAYTRLGAGESDERARKELRRAIKGQIDSIAGKYILPEQDTTEYALMYVPSEAVYHHIVATDENELLEYALSRRVIPSSPGHLYAFLASMAAVYAEAGLTGNTRRLTAVVTALTESLAKLDGVHERMAGSARALSRGLDKARVETDGMRQQLSSLQETAWSEDETAASTGKTDDKDKQ